MQNKKIYFVVAVVLIVVAIAAFVGGRLLNGGVNPLGMFPIGGGGNSMPIEINMTPAPELPTTQPDTQGAFIERKDNTIIIQTFSMEAGGGPIVSQGGEQGPQMEVVITNETIIYRDATEMPAPSGVSESLVVQQVMEEGSLDDLTSDSMIMVWGRKSGDRIIADVILYSQPVLFKGETP